MFLRFRMFLRFSLELGFVINIFKPRIYMRSCTGGAIDRGAPISIDRIVVFMRSTLYLCDHLAHDDLILCVRSYCYYLR